MIDNPHMVDITRHSIQGVNKENYDYSWIRGEILLFIECDDGLVIVVYNPWIKDEKMQDVSGQIEKIE
jgi:hypothetical protein